MATVAVIPGDGVGPEVTAEAMRVLERAAEIEGLKIRTQSYPFGADHYLRTRELMPNGILDEFKQMDAIFLGAIGDPRVETGVLERAIIGGMRWGELDMYINLRPIKLYADYLCPLKDKTPDDIDMIFVRENTEDLYIGVGGHFKKGTPDEVAIQQMIMTRKGVERAIRYAFELTRKRNKRKKLTLIDKANAIGTMDIWTRTFEEVGREYPDIERDHAFIDAACMWMVKNPEWFDVAVTGNMMGDIITDLGAAISGGLGIAASGNIHPGQVSMFEPIHGSAPKHAGKGLICPLAAISAVQMMLDYLGHGGASARIEKALAQSLTGGEIRSLSTNSGMSTSGYTDVVLKHMR
jgi:3-isopropylmalate dehydrogenase